MITVKFYKVKKGKTSERAFATYSSDDWINTTEAKGSAESILESDFPDLQDKYVIKTFGKATKKNKSGLFNF
jgi:hypothetical protein